MRVGINPQKLEKKLELNTRHRIIVVVFIPELKGFYENSFEVFKLCIDSLVSSITKDAAITVVNNGSCIEVESFLNQYLSSKKIDTVIHHSKNIGKIDALIGAARGSREKLITLADSDILFKIGWQQNVENIFSNFKDVGSVSPIPVRTGMFYGTSSVLLKLLLKQLKFVQHSIPENFDDYNRYLESINWDKESDVNAKWSILISNKVKAIIGSGHQVLTINRDILFKTIPSNPSLTLVGGSSEYDYVDAPIDRAGKMRLSTYNNFAYHMGNNPEKWMKDVVFENQNFIITEDNVGRPETLEQTDLLNTLVSEKMYSFRKKWVKKIFKKIYN